MAQKSVYCSLNLCWAKVSWTFCLNFNGANVYRLQHPTVLFTVFTKLNHLFTSNKNNHSYFTLGVDRILWPANYTEWSLFIVFKELFALFYRSMRSQKSIPTRPRDRLNKFIMASKFGQGNVTNFQCILRFILHTNYIVVTNRIASPLWVVNIGQDIFNWASTISFYFLSPTKKIQGIS